MSAARPGPRAAAALGGLLVLLLLPLGATRAGAALREVDAVGAVPAESDSPRVAALRAGVREAVLRVAADVARAGGAASDDPEALGAALGEDPFPYTVRYELLEDRGERPAQLLPDAAGGLEYVVVVKAQVDEDRVAARLRAAGLLGRLDPARARLLRVVFEGVHRHETWRQLERALAGRGGRVQPVEFAYGRVEALVETDETGSALVERLQRAVGERFGVGAGGDDGSTLWVRIDEPPDPLEPAPAAGSEPAAPAASGPPPI